MSEVPNATQKSPSQPAQPKQDAAKQIAVPTEYSSRNMAVKITKQADELTIELHPTIVEEIGAYRRCPVKVIFKEGQSVIVHPILPM